MSLFKFIFNKKFCAVLLFSAVFIYTFISCDILRVSPFEVVHWSPGTGYKDINGGLIIAVTFSHEPDKSSIESAFELQENGVKRAGVFLWNNGIFYFSPSAPLENNHEYSIIIGTGAQDIKGISLDERFEGTWTTRPSDARPEVQNISPQDNELIEPGWSEVAIYFSTLIDINSCNKHISFSPQINGTWHLDQSERKAVFTPNTLWKHGQTYKITISSLFESKFGITTGKETISRFTIVGETIPPELLEIIALDKNENDIMPLVETPSENTAWESSYTMRLLFSEPVNIASLKKAISIEPSLSFEIKTANAVSCAQTAYISFTNAPIFGEHYLLKINSGIKDISGNESNTAKTFRIYANGVHSKPPLLKSLTIENGEFTRNYRLGEDNFENIPNNISGAGSITLFFEMARNAQVDLFSLMEVFSLSSTNSVLIFNTSEMRRGAENSAGESSVIIEGSFINDMVEEGIVTISVGQGLLDSLGNKQTEMKNIVLLK